MNRRLFVLGAGGALVSAATGAVLASGSRSRSAKPTRRVLVLGFDGLDPQILGDLIRADKLPHFKQLAGRGAVRPLATTNPPLSPVAWSTFITGMNPGGHGVFDFIHRDPETLVPYLSTSRSEPASRVLRLGNWVLPLSPGKVTLLRQGVPFWQQLEDRGVPTRMVRVPANFPPTAGGGYQLTGMGTPDLQGTYGIFSFFTDEPVEKYRGVSGGEVFPVRVTRENRVRAQLFGPPNGFRAGSPPSAVDFEVYIDAVNPVAKIVVQGQEIILRPGEWSPWVRLRFEMIPWLESVSGIVRFYLKGLRPRFGLYASPVNIDPAAPALPISTPEGYAHELCDDLGPFYTQGMPHDTKALSHGILDDSEFLQQARIVFDEQARMFEHELGRFREGLLFLYSDRVDQLAHMFWRMADRRHAAHDPTGAFARVIEDAYRDMDRVVGRALGNLDDRTTLLIMSDHGFAPFYRAFNLNTWLKAEGYLTTRSGSGAEAAEFADSIKWGETRAYGLGLNGLYLNLGGRERDGMVRAGGARDALAKELAAKLLAVRDPATGEHVVRRVYRSEDIYTGRARSEAPDLIVGYGRGYRVAWESVLGLASSPLLADNADKWSGDHAIAGELVPGVLLASKPVKADDPDLVDLAPTILGEFDVPKADSMTGRSLL